MNSRLLYISDVVKGNEMRIRDGDWGMKDGSK